MVNESDIMAVASRLSSARRAKGFRTPEDCARAYGWRKHTYRAHETGARGIKPQVAEKYGAALGFKAEWLLFGGHNKNIKESGNSKKETLSQMDQAAQVDSIILPLNDYGDIPMYGTISVSSPEIIRFTGEYMINEVKRHPSVFKVRGAFAMQVAGDSMFPRYKSGEKVWIHPRQVPVIGQDCVIVSAPDGNASVKEFRGETATEWKFYQWNPARELSIDKSDVHKIFAVAR